MKLSEIADLKNGHAFKSKDYIDYSNTLNCRMSNIRPDGKFDLSYNPKYLPDHFYDKYESYRLHDDDVIIAMTDMANEPKILGVPTLVKTNGKNVLLNQRVGKLEYDRKAVSFGYLNYVLNREIVKNYYKQFAGGGLQINLGKRDLLSVKIPLPSLSEQKAIVAKLDRAQRLIDIDKAMLAKYDQLIQSVFLEMFGDLRSNEKGFEKLTIDDISEKVTDGDHKTPNRTETGIMLLSARNIKNGYIDLEEKVDHIPQEEYDRMINRCLPEFGDILISCSGTIGRVTKVNIHEPFNMVRSVALVKPTKEKINSTYLESMLQSEYLQSEMTKSANTSSQSNLFLGPIKKLPVVLPPLGLQKEFEKNINRIRVEKSKTENSLLKSEALFSSLVQEVFG
ncbi:MAG: restriction endonuclease subunit S [Balneolaceae bacterium]|nr:restriction endonuclease subunit S [Balneolaceae bacterium]